MSARTGDSSSQRGQSTRKLIVIVVFAVLAFGLLWLALTAAGKSRPDDIHADYGQRHGGFASDSVNGTAVFANMFERRGFEVITWRKLSPRLDKVDTIVWFPDDVDPPTKEQRIWLEQWLADGFDRTLIYVGRDYDAEIVYWEKMLPGSPADEQTKIKRRLTEARQRHQEIRKSMPNNENVSWFVVKRGSGKQIVSSLEGPWAYYLDDARTWIELQGYLAPPTDDQLQSEVLLRSQDTPLVTRVMEGSYIHRLGSGQIIAVSNGSFLLNLPLVNPEHRKLAGLLIDECSGSQVAFVESGRYSALQVREVDYDSQKQAWYNMLTVWPINAVILHVAAAGIVFCFAMFPIFGRPRTADADEASDFGKHIDAMGKLLAKTHDSEYAISRLAYYEETVKRDSGASHSD